MKIKVTSNQDNSRMTLVSEDTRLEEILTQILDERIELEAPGSATIYKKKVSLKISYPCSV